MSGRLPGPNRSLSSKFVDSSVDPAVELETGPRAGRAGWCGTAAVAAVGARGGALTGGGTGTGAGTLTWSGGAMGGSGTTEAQGGLTLTTNATASLTDTRTLQNDAVATWSGGFPISAAAGA